MEEINGTITPESSITGRMDVAGIGGGSGGNVDDVKVNGTSVVTNKVANVTVPTKTSDLTNDSEFITSDDIPAVPTKTSDLTNDSDFTTSAAVAGQLDLKQNKLVAGSNITIDEDTNTISATGGGSGTTYTAGDNIQITGNVISATDTVYDDTEIRGDVTDLNNALNQLTTTVNGKQNTLVSGSNIKTVNGVSIVGGGNAQIFTTENTIALSDNPNAGVDLTVDGVSRTLANQIQLFSKSYVWANFTPSSHYNLPNVGSSLSSLTPSPSGVGNASIAVPVYEGMIVKVCGMTLAGTNTVGITDRNLKVLQKINRCNESDGGAIIEITEDGYCLVSSLEAQFKYLSTTGVVSDLCDRVDTLETDVEDLQLLKSQITTKEYALSDFMANKVYANMPDVGQQISSLVPTNSGAGNNAICIPITKGKTVKACGMSANGRDTLLVVNNDLVVLTKINRCNATDGGAEINILEDGYVLFTTTATQFAYLTVSSALDDKIKEVLNGYCEDIYAPYPQLPADDSEEADFDSDNITSEDIFTYIDAIVSKHPNMITKEYLGKDSTNQYDINRYIVGDKTNTNYLATIYIGANEHGPTSDPRECAITVCRLINDLCKANAKTNRYLNILKKYFRFVVIPVQNPWGFNNNSRNNGNNVNINRNYATEGWVNVADTDKGASAGSEVETQYIMSTISDYSCNIALDLHCLGNVTVANDMHCHYAGHIDKESKITQIKNSMKRDYELICTNYGAGDYTQESTGDAYFHQLGIKGLLLEFQSRDGVTGASDSALHTSNIMEANYTFLLRIINMLLSDYSESFDISKFN